MDLHAILDLARGRAGLFARQHRLQPADFDDAIQEATIAAFKALPHFVAARGKLGAYLSVCIDRALRRWRHQRQLVRPSYARRSLTPRIVALEFDPPAPEPGEVFDEMGGVRQIVHVLPYLPLAERTVIVHLLAEGDLSGLTRKLRVSRQALSVRKQRALARLRRLLQQ